MEYLVSVIDYETVFTYFSCAFLLLEPRNCSESEKQCLNKMCILSKKWCDGETDCPDGSDEKNCSKIYIK